MKLLHCLSLIAVLTLGDTLAAQVLDLSAIPPDCPADRREDLTRRREQLQARWDGFLAHQAAFASAFAGTKVGTPQAAEALRRKQELKTEADAIIDEADRFNTEVAGLPHPRAAETDIVQRIFEGMPRLARALGWDDEKCGRLDRALHELQVEGKDTNDTELRQTWNALLARRGDAALAEEARRGGGPAWASAGRQTHFNDCAIFALANAARLPYGVVAARATKLLREGDWRSQAERDDPQGTIERQGLNGGEVIMLAESFGQAEVVHLDDIAATLRGGRPVMINTMLVGGGAHEVALTRTFTHGGETWYEMIESNQKPQDRLYLSHQELEIVARESGVAYRPEKGTVVVPPN